MELIPSLIIAAAVFGICFAVDKGFTKAFRSKVQHKSGLSVRLSKRYASVGLILLVVGLAALFMGLGKDWVLAAGGGFVILMGMGLVVYYMTFGIFYDEDTFLLTTFGAKSKAYSHSDITAQMLYKTANSTLIELHLSDGRAVQLQSTMSGVYPFLDTAFSGWCRQKDIDPNSCEFHDPANSLWFPKAGD